MNEENVLDTGWKGRLSSIQPEPLNPPSSLSPTNIVLSSNPVGFIYDTSQYIVKSDGREI